MSIFSGMPPFLHEERGGHHIELQLVPDDELMDIWEQTQRAVYMLEEKGWDAGPALRYCDMLVWEMQRRLARLPLGRRFGNPAIVAADMPDLREGVSHIVTLRI